MRILAPSSKQLLMGNNSPQRDENRVDTPLTFIRQMLFSGDVLDISETDVFQTWLSIDVEVCMSFIPMWKVRGAFQLIAKEE